MDILNEERFEKGGVVLERLHPELSVEPFIPYYERMGYEVKTNVLPNGWTEIIGEKINKPDSDIVEYLQNHSKDEAYRLNNSNWNSRFISNAQYNVNRDYITNFAKGGRLRSIMKDIHNYNAPFSVVAVDTDNRKVLEQAISIQDWQLIPAHYRVLKEKYPNATIRVEDGTGISLFAKGGRTTHSRRVDARRLSKEPWEQAYKSKRKGNYYAKGGEVCPTCGSFAKGGMVDLFEDYEKLPKDARDIYAKYEAKIIEGDYNYKDSKNFLKEMESAGYTFDYGLDNEPYGLRPIGVSLNELEGFEEFAKGGKTKINWSEYYEKGGTIMSKEMKDKLFDSDGTRKIDRKSIKELTDYVNSLEQTKSKHFNEKTKKYSPARQKLHKEILNEFKDNLVCIESDEPIAILMGGSPASGKSTFLKKYAPYLLSEELLRIDADEVRSMLPEYEGWNASQTHLETKDIVNTLLSDRTIGLPCNFDLIYDGTMNNTKSYLPLIKILKELGYKIYVVYIDNVPKDVIVDRALKRYQKSGRFVPLEVIDDFFSKGKSALNEIKKEVDGYMIVDGGNNNYNIIEEGGMKLPQNREYSKIGSPIN